MKAFTIDEVLIYNPQLKSKKKKPIQSDIQQAKIMAFYPDEAPIQQKCNTVGMAQGVYTFCDSLLPQELRQKSVQTIFMDSCCTVQKQFEKNIWIFLKISFTPEKYYGYRLGREKDSDIQQSQIGYIKSQFNEQVLQDFINHFYRSFYTFYGKIQAYLNLEKLFELQKIIDYFVPTYHQINSYPSKEPVLDMSTYLIKNIRVVPLDINTTLKFGYFKNVLQSYEPAVMDLAIFANGFLAYSSLDKKTTQFFGQYLFGCGQPFKFDYEKIPKRFNILPELPVFNSIEKYGSIFNSIVFGFEDDLNKPLIRDSRSSIAATSYKKSSNQQDLLGIQQKQQIQLIDVYLTKQNQQVKYKLNYFMQKNMVFLTFYKQITALNQLIFSNRFFHDNNHKFSIRISQVLTSISKNDNYRFLFVNKSTCAGKCTFKDWTVMGHQVIYALNRIKRSVEGQVATTFQNYWIYGVKRMNRILVLVIPNQVPLHKLEDFTNKMTRQYFFKCFM